MTDKRPYEKDWTEEHDALLKREYGKGRLSAGDIGGRMGRSRNSVIGRAHRLGLKAKFLSPKRRNVA